MATLGQAMFWSASVADAGTLDLNPGNNNNGVDTSSGTVEAMIQEIEWPGGNSIEIMRVDSGGNEIQFYPKDPSKALDLGSIEHRAYRTTDDNFIRVKNTSGGTIRIMAGGSVTRT